MSAQEIKRKWEDTVSLVATESRNSFFGLVVVIVLTLIVARVAHLHFHTFSTAFVVIVLGSLVALPFWNSHEECGKRRSRLMQMVKLASNERLFSEMLENYRKQWGYK